jgi:chemotaxis protein methyltransferase CheR
VLGSRAAERARLRGVPLDAYARDLDEAELDALIEALRVGETRFFRHAAQVEALERVVVPALARARAAARRVRAWSAGCATGEEAYTLAMLLGERLPGWTHEVLGTDLSDEALARARAGRYPAAAIDERRRRRWFRVDGEHVVVSPALAVRFERRNLLEPPPAGPWDIVLCRNVLMYFDASTRRDVVERLLDVLADDGYLLVGYAESMRDVEGVEALEVGVYRKAAPEDVNHKDTKDTKVRIRPIVPFVSLWFDPPGGPVRITGSPGVDDVAAMLREALARNTDITVDLDGAELLDDGVATVLRRAAAAARAAGVAFTITATRPGPRRWVERHGLP